MIASLLLEARHGAAGGFVPLAPYIATDKVSVALLFSIGVTVIALFIFGFVKGDSFAGDPAAPSANGLHRQCRT